MPCKQSFVQHKKRESDPECLKLPMEVAKAILAVWTACLYWLFRNSFKRLSSLNFTHTLTLRHWQCHCQLPRSSVADSNLHKLFCMLLYADRNGYLLGFCFFPYLLPAPFSGLGKYDRCLCRPKQIWEGLCIFLLWVYHTEEHSMTGDNSSSLGI